MPAVVASVTLGGDELLDVLEHPTTRAEHSAADRSRAAPGPTALLTRVRLVAEPAESPLVCRSYLSGLELANANAAGAGL